jgi:hypothetical protein
VPITGVFILQNQLASWLIQPGKYLKQSRGEMIFLSRQVSSCPIPLQGEVPARISPREKDDYSCNPPISGSGSVNNGTGQEKA